jgi:hypothetical protein
MKKLMLATAVAALMTSGALAQTPVRQLPVDYNLVSRRRSLTV